MTDLVLIRELEVGATRRWTADVYRFYSEDEHRNAQRLLDGVLDPENLEARQIQMRGEFGNEWAAHKETDAIDAVIDALDESTSDIRQNFKTAATTPIHILRHGAAKPELVDRLT